MDLNQLTSLSNALVAAEAATKAAEDALRSAKEHERFLREEVVPAALQELGVTKIVLDTQETVSYKQEVYASLSADRKPAAFDWLDKHGHGGMITTDVTLEFGKEQRSDAVEYVEQLRERGFNPVLKMDVHAGTLKAFLREQLANGADVPLDLFGARAVFQATVKAPTKKKS